MDIDERENDGVNTFTIAGKHKNCTGSIDDHVVIKHKEPTSYEFLGKNDKYEVIYRAWFNPGFRSNKEDRGWRKEKTITTETLEEAVKTAKRYGKKHKLPVYHQIDPWSVEVIQKPRNWEPRFG